ncbi:glucose 1-dehydrogenase [Falsigemmobacter faecalis]|uniref:Glucose 1-dehydrogenase n=1 Tax=Falsigemmobacter faecalis TaxID=2488730 RepID=A0A3P3DWR0_9RHOB|nr:glucose 1-dehydrogenase [Falsigemmobacter faecalis]RRH78414.1 glucose 1-dehydrogenase [Falsigemmobacter faecalis]
MRLQGKTAIVTGAGSGFGAGIARRFVQEGARVILADINPAAAEAVAAEIGGIAVACNVADGASVAALAEAAKAAFGGAPDILVNNAGVTHLPGFMEEISEADFDRVLAVNAKSIYLMARAFAGEMKARRSGAILNIASTAGVSPRPKLSWYNASKGFVITATRAMAVELAPFGVRVNALNPVAGETPLLASFMGEDTPEMRAKFLSTIPLGRFSTPEDLANAALYLCSDEASMVTGVAMEVDGGRCI